MHKDLTVGSITGAMPRLTLPMILDSLLQQFYDIADTLIVGCYLEASALVAVGVAYALMIPLTSVLLGLGVRSRAVFSLRFGEKNSDMFRNNVFIPFAMITAVALAVNADVFLFIDPIVRLLCTPGELYALMREYLWIVFYGIFAISLYNFFASLLRTVGDSFIPLVFLGVAAVLNVILDLVFVLVFHWGVGGAAGVTVIAQLASGVGIRIYAFVKMPEFRIEKSHMRTDRHILGEASQFLFPTCAQQSAMDFGILMVQGLMNSFGTVVMAAFAAAVKIDSFAYMPVQDFGNVFSAFVAQNYGVGRRDRIKAGIKSAVIVSISFCLFISATIWIFTKQPMLIFVRPQETEVLAVGMGCLRIEGTFYWGIGCLFPLYGLYRAVRRPGMSVILIAISLGTRVALVYVLTSIPSIGVTGVWVSAPIGWILADLAGFLYYERVHKEL